MQERITPTTGKMILHAEWHEYSGEYDDEKYSGVNLFTDEDKKVILEIYED
jgi:hypothetical protein